MLPCNTEGESSGHLSNTTIWLHRWSAETSLGWCLPLVTSVINHSPWDRRLLSLLAFLVFLSLPAHRNRSDGHLDFFKHFDAFKQEKNICSHHRQKRHLVPEVLLEPEGVESKMHKCLNGEKHNRAQFVLARTDVLLTLQSKEQHWNTRNDN